MRLNALVVSAYKLVGFAALCAILCGLTGYLATNFFFLVSSSWVAPAILSPSDEHVMQLSAQYAQQSSLRDKLLADRYELVARRADALRTVTARRNFEDQFRRAIEAEFQAKSRQLQTLRGLEAGFRAGKPHILSSNREYSGISRRRLAALAQAHLIENDSLAAGHFQLSQIEHSNLFLAERETLLGNQREALDREVRALRQVLDSHLPEATTTPQMLGTDSLRLEEECTRTVLERQKAEDLAEALARSIEAADASLGRYEQVLRGIHDSPFMRAADHSLVVAAVPYENIRNAAPGTPLYLCRLGFVFCRKVGEVGALIDGEIQVKHPLHSRVLRGQMVEIAVQDRDAVVHSVLFARKPLFF